MPGDSKDDRWIGRLLSQHADRRELDLEAFLSRIETEVEAETEVETSTTAPGGHPVVVTPGPGRRPEQPRRRLTPVLVAAASVLVVVGVGVTVLPRWSANDGRGAVAGTPSPGQGPGPGPAQNSARTSTSSLEGTVPAPGRSATSVPPPQSSRAPASGAPTAGPGRAVLPSTFRWRSDAPVILPRTGAGGVTALKDPTVVRYGGKWHVFATTVSGSGYGLAYLSFADWSQANAAKLQPLDAAPLGPGFRAAPQVFYFAPQKLWYLVYQTGAASYSTNPDITDPRGWTAPKPFYSGVPDLIRKNLSGGFWVDMWVICDDRDCHLFSSDNRGHLFRSQTPKADFPDGMSQPVIAVQDEGQGSTFAAGAVYSIAGTQQFLLLSQAFGGDGNGYLRSWTASHPTGPWTGLAATAAAPFVGASNTAYPGRAWTRSIVQGELLRDGYDERLTVDPCRLQLLYLGLNPDFKDNRTFQLGLASQANPACT